MPQTAGPVVGINYGWAVGEDGWAAGMNFNLQMIEAMLDQTVVNTTNAPPVSPLAFAKHIIGTSPTGEWTGKANQIAIRFGGGWSYITPKAGWETWDTAAGAKKRFNGTTWTTI